MYIELSRKRSSLNVYVRIFKEDSGIKMAQLDTGIVDFSGSLVFGVVL